MPRPDRRAGALIAAAVATLLFGGLLAWNAQPSAPTAPAATRVHAREAADREVRSRFQQGVMMLHAGRHDHALTAFHRVLELAPDLPEAHVNTGFALLGSGRLAAARGFFESAIELNRDQLNAYYGLGMALEATGDLEGAIGAMRSYVHLARPDDPYRRKAEAALWEWRTRTAQRSAGKVPDVRESARQP